MTEKASFGSWQVTQARPLLPISLKKGLLDLSVGPARFRVANCPAESRKTANLGMKPPWAAASEVHKTAIMQKTQETILKGPAERLTRSASLAPARIKVKVAHIRERFMEFSSISET